LWPARSKDGIRVESTHEPIVDMDTWNLCQEIDKKRYKPRSTGSGEVSLFGGLVKCSDCGFAMWYNEENHIRKGGRKVKYISYMCGNYSRSGKSACSAHIIYLTPLSELVLDDIRTNTNRVLEDEEKVRRELMHQKAKQTDEQLTADKAALKAARQRLTELERLTQALYEDKVLGTVPEAVCRNLMQKYESEREEKSEFVQTLTQKIAEIAQDERDIESFITAIKKYVAVEQIDREMLLELINYIEIGERKELHNQKYRDITVHYNFVDKIS
jgi:site-specific DNA recombinase